MEEKISVIKDLSIDEREEIFVDVARSIERTAHEAIVEGDRRFAALTANMAEAIRVNADERARDDLQNAERVLRQVSSMISQFNAVHPHRMVSSSIH